MPLVMTFSPVLLLLLGAIAVPLTKRIARARVADGLAVAVAGGTIVFCALLYRSQPIGWSVALWRPTPLFGVELGYHADSLSLLFLLLIAFFTLLAVLSASTFFAPMGRRSFPHGAVFLTGAGACSLILSADLITLALSWGLLDLAILLLAAVAHEGPAASRTGQRLLLVNYLAGVALLGALLVLQAQGEIFSIQAAPLPVKAISLMLAAALLRAGLYPAAVGLPSGVDMEVSTLMAWYAIPLSAGGYLLARTLGLAVVASLPGRELALVLGSLAVILSPFPLWFVNSLRGAVPYIVLNQVGHLALATAVAPSSPSAIIVSQTISLVLALGLLLLSQSAADGPTPRFHAIWKRCCVLTAVATLVAAPLTVGFVGRQLLYASLVEADLVPLVLLSAVANAFLVAPLLKTGLVEREEDPDRVEARPALLVGLTAMAIPLVVFGLHPPVLGLMTGSRSTVVAWPSVVELVYSSESALPMVLSVVTLLSLALGYLAYLKGEAIVARAGVSLETLYVVAEMGWILRGLDWAVERGARILEQTGGFFEDTRFQGWMLAFAVLVALLLLSS